MDREQAEMEAARIAAALEALHEESPWESYPWAEEGVGSIVCGHCNGYGGGRGIPDNDWECRHCDGTGWVAAPHP
jgi:hypothetical protein